MESSPADFFDREVRRLRDRDPETLRLLRHFSFGHLQGDLRAVSQHSAFLAVRMADVLVDGPDLWDGLRSLLAAKDWFVRAKLWQELGEV